MINELIKEAMKSKNKVALNAYRSVKSRILLEKTKKGSSDLKDDEVFLNCVQSEIKERKEANSFIKDEGNATKIENLEIISILETHLPQKIQGEALKQLIEEKMNLSQAKSSKDMGKVMALLKDYKHQLDMQEASSLVKTMLS